MVLYDESDLILSFLGSVIVKIRMEMLKCKIFILTPRYLIYICDL